MAFNIHNITASILLHLFHTFRTFTKQLIHHDMRYCVVFMTFTSRTYYILLHALLQAIYDIHYNISYLITFITAFHDLHNNSYFITFTTAMYLQYSKQQFIFYCIHYCNSFTTFTTLTYTLLYSLLLKSLQEYYYFNNCEDVVESQVQSSPAIGHTLLSSFMHCLLLRVISSFARPNWKHTVIHISKTRGVRSRGSPLVSCIYVMK